jgi:hypothetical protein
VDIALLKDIRVEATFRNMNDDKMQELTQEILLVSEMISHLRERKMSRQQLEHEAYACKRHSLASVS